MSDFSEILAAWIKSRISTLEELGAISGYNRCELSRIANGKRVANEFEIQCITESMDVIERAHVAKHKQVAAVEDIHRVARSIEAARVDERKHGHYYKDVSNVTQIDVYAVLRLFEVTDPCLQHIVKKALCAGKRGAKDFAKDVQEIADTAARLVELEAGK